MSIAKPVPFDTTLEIRDGCLCLQLRRAARAATRRFDAAFRPLGLTSGQFSMLMALNRPDPATIGAVASLLAMDRTTLTADLKPLARRGLVAIAADPDDRRSRRLELTAAGHALLAAALPVWRRQMREERARLGDADPRRLRAALRALS
jgi:DNA-binding MarR family transcriptional regulator